MTNNDADTALVARLAPRLQALHEANGGDWANTMRDARALMREIHRIEPQGGPGAEQPDTPREDD